MKRFKPDLEAIDAELEAQEPDKEEVKDRLEGVTKRIKKLSGSVEAAKELQEQVSPITLENSTLGRCRLKLFLLNLLASNSLLHLIIIST